MYSLAWSYQMRCETLSCNQFLVNEKELFFVHYSGKILILCRRGMDFDDLEDSNDGSLEDFPKGGTKRKWDEAKGKEKAVEGDSEEEDEESNPGTHFF